MCYLYCNSCIYFKITSEKISNLSEKISIHQNLFIYLGFYVAFNTVQVISRRVVGRAEETSTYSLLGFCTVNCRPTARNYQLSHLRPCRESNPGFRGGRRECYHSATVAPYSSEKFIPHSTGFQGVFLCYFSCGSHYFSLHNFRNESHLWRHRFNET